MIFSHRKLYDNEAEIVYYRNGKDYTLARIIQRRNKHSHKKGIWATEKYGLVKDFEEIVIGLLENPNVDEDKRTEALQVEEFIKYCKNTSVLTPSPEGERAIMFDAEGREWKYS